ncbi:hypothetical protein [Ktedonospora formicarum]|uniref:Uncharacterized protein n=1 Tax=Ktedonospora formicarum TaxID=2778364 RepID=A0A8J3MPK5_9CHLR|nr:hypothetical protein [Ktedonospora formicarum]GHO43917.1 hypothetical protein KSX_20800 [Ktedonospora formicarum]
MHLTDFLHYIKETWGIGSREAMQYLNVRSLSTINRRAAVARLHELLDKEQRTGQEASQRSMPARSSERPHTAPSVDTQPPQIQNRVGMANVDAPMPTSAPSAQAIANQPIRLVPEGTNGHAPGAKIMEVMAPAERGRPVRTFDEEIEPEDLEGLADLEEIGPASAPSALMHLAYDKLHQLREIKGATVVREHRLKVLNNVVGDQISEAQLQKLIEGIWNVPTLKKLKLDQNEALITWAKEDDFVPEAEAVLQLLEEEQ